MCDVVGLETKKSLMKTVPLHNAVGMVLVHDITEIRLGEFKGRAFKKGHIIRKEDINHLKRLGKERLFVLNISDDEMHEDEAAYILAKSLKGNGVELQGEPSEGKINLIAGRDGLLKINKDVLLELNMLGDVMCATFHNNTFVRKGQIIAGTRAIPLVIKKSFIEKAVWITNKMRKTGFNSQGSGVIKVKEIKSPKAGVVITGNEVYHGRIKDAFAPVIEKKIRALNGEIIDVFYSPDDEFYIEKRLLQLIDAGADLLIVTGGMSVDPDDVTRFAIRKLGVKEAYYGSAVLPGAMFLVAYLENNSVKNKVSKETNQTVPILGIPACGMYHETTVFDLVLPRILAGEHIGRKELAETGHGGLCLNCKECRYPVCPFGKD